MLLTNKGMGGYLCPPGHPNNNNSYESPNTFCSVAYILNNPKEFSIEIQKEVNQLLADYNKNKPQIDSPEVKDWINRVLFHFHNCYSPENHQEFGWRASDALIIEGDPFEIGIDRHYGVHCIRKFYPLYEPTKEELYNAYNRTG